jgi:Spy/CpxP family protein refolding chaperone
MPTPSVRRVLRAAVHAASAAALVALVAVQAHAQGQPPVTKDQPPAGGGMRGGGGGARMQQMLFEGITLTDAQKAKVDSITASYRQQMQSMPRPEPGTPPTEEQRAARQKMMQDQQAALRAVLTPEQQATFDKNVESMRSRMGGGRPPR